MVTSVITGIILDEPGGARLVTGGLEVLLGEGTLDRLGTAFLVNKFLVNKEVTGTDSDVLVTGIKGAHNEEVALLAPVSSRGFSGVGTAESPGAWSQVLGFGVVLIWIYCITTTKTTETPAR
jgi:hypothetical protein